MLAGCNADGRDSVGDGSMAQHIVRAGGFFNPPGIEVGKLLHLGNGFVYGPCLVGIEHHLAIGTNLSAHELSAAQIIFRISPP